MRNSVTRLGLTLATLGYVALAQAGNPVITERFSADPAALVHDGVVYLYAGHDQAAEDGDFFVLKEWSIYSSEDLKDWTLEGSLPRTEFEWARGDTAWASQAIERDNKFYWYVTVLNDDPDPERSGFALGVAVSDHPVHGWQDAIGGPLVTSDMTEAPEFMDAEETWDNIDPTVFIDEEGQAHLYWGNTHLYYAPLKDNMIELEGDIQQIEIANMPGTFTEAPWLHEYEGLYYLTFAMNYPEELAYATSDNPEGPWEYAGLIMDTLEDSGTSHQAVLEYEDQWYLIYHTAALPTGGNYRRAVSMEHLNYNEDGSIQKITPTASGIHYQSKHLQSVANGQAYIAYDEQPEITVGPFDEAHHFSFEWHLKSLQDIDNTLSFQPETRAGYYLAEQGGTLQISRHDGTDEFIQKTTFERVEGLSDESAESYRLLHSPEHYLMLDGETLVLTSPQSESERQAATFHVHSSD
ncbi:xylosidase/arabinosidase [Aliidiomarina minuta]|uniref:Xylosidase/arabinosidase n=1 Tax=Aliidiomarina minuta TaxID=880057 RepID=A0A432W5U0_9GAMM|nr:family 43 glycosylhydrolase [Aliidiomarina minuta]RUO25435.1 xylosidase/arabinosidase [Aliidiomarina minuta]